ncbi:MAG: helix-turn-helix domain-containing protein [Verrucomicrobia bacterium]|nr:helix-turn-helix domain-containing protein [Verrucomicrobiota bacterium]
MPSIGEILRETRVKKGISEAAAAAAIKIKVERLRDLEENRYDSFSAQVYVRSFLRHYAEHVGLDSGPILQRFTEENPPAPHKPVFEVTEEQRTRSPIQRVPGQSPRFFLTATGRAVLAALLMILAVVSVSIWWLMKSQPSRSVHAPPPTPPPAVEESPAPARKPADSWEPSPFPVSPPTSSHSFTSTNAAPFEIRRAP